MHTLFYILYFNNISFYILYTNKNNPVIFWIPSSLKKPYSCSTTYPKIVGDFKIIFVLFFLIRKDKLKWAYYKKYIQLLKTIVFVFSKDAILEFLGFNQGQQILSAFLWATHLMKFADSHDYKLRISRCKLSGFYYICLGICQRYTKRYLSLLGLESCKILPGIFPQCSKRPHAFCALKGQSIKGALLIY